MAELDPQDPLPEPGWLFRRLFTYAVTCALLYLMWLGVERLAQVAFTEPGRGINALADTLFWLIILLWSVVTYYLVAPSAEQIVKMIQAARIIRAQQADSPPPERHDDGPRMPPSQGGSGRRGPAEKTPWE